MELDGAEWIAICDHAARHGVEVDPDQRPQRCSGGLANRNYVVRLRAGGNAVLRMPPPGPLPPGAHDMEREHRILAHLWRELPLAPRSLLLCTDTDVARTSFHLLELKDGVAVRGDSVAPFPASPETGRRLSHIAVDVLVRVHGTDPAAIGLGSLGRPEGFLARTASGWMRRAVKVTGGELAGDLLRLAEWLQERTGGAGGDGTLLHNDFKLDNLLLHPATMQPTAILDWDMGTRGDALFDLATLLSYWTEAGDPECMHRLAQMPTAQPGFLRREEAALLYARATGRSLDAFQVYRVAAMFKLCVVFLQLHSRYRSGEVTDLRYAAFDQLAREIAGFTLRIAAGHVF